MSSNQRNMEAFAPQNKSVTISKYNMEMEKRLKELNRQKVEAFLQIPSRANYLVMTLQMPNVLRVLRNVVKKHRLDCLSIGFCKWHTTFKFQKCVRQKATEEIDRCIAGAMSRTGLMPGGRSKAGVDESGLRTGCVAEDSNHVLAVLERTSTAAPLELAVSENVDHLPHQSSPPATVFDADIVTDTGTDTETDARVCPGEQSQSIVVEGESHSHDERAGSAAVQIQSLFRGYVVRGYRRNEKRCELCSFLREWARGEARNLFHHESLQDEESQSLLLAAYDVAMSPSRPFHKIPSMCDIEYTYELVRNKMHVISAKYQPLRDFYSQLALERKTMRMEDIESFHLRRQVRLDELRQKERAEQQRLEFMRAHREQIRVGRHREANQSKIGLLSERKREEIEREAMCREDGLSMEYNRFLRRKTQEKQDLDRELMVIEDFDAQRRREQDAVTMATKAEMMKQRELVRIAYFGDKKDQVKCFKCLQESASEPAVAVCNADSDCFCRYHEGYSGDADAPYVFRPSADKMTSSFRFGVVLPHSKEDRVHTKRERARTLLLRVSMSCGRSQGKHYENLLHFDISRNNRRRSWRQFCSHVATFRATHTELHCLRHKLRHDKIAVRSVRLSYLDKTEKCEIMLYRLKYLILETSREVVRGLRDEVDEFVESACDAYSDEEIRALIREVPGNAVKLRMIGKQSPARASLSKSMNINEKAIKNLAGGTAEPKFTSRLQGIVNGVEVLLPKSRNRHRQAKSSPSPRKFVVDDSVGMAIAQSNCTADGTDDNVYDEELEKYVIPDFEVFFKQCDAEVFVKNDPFFKSRLNRGALEPRHFNRQGVRGHRNFLKQSADDYNFIKYAAAVQKWLRDTTQWMAKLEGAWKQRHKSDVLLIWQRLSYLSGAVESEASKQGKRPAEEQSCDRSYAASVLRAVEELSMQQMMFLKLCTPMVRLHATDPLGLQIMNLEVGSEAFDAAVGISAAALYGMSALHNNLLNNTSAQVPLIENSSTLITVTLKKLFIHNARCPHCLENIVNAAMKAEREHWQAALTHLFHEGGLIRKTYRKASDSLALVVPRQGISIVARLVRSMRTDDAWDVEVPPWMKPGLRWGDHACAEPFWRKLQREVRSGAVGDHWKKYQNEMRILLSSKTILDYMKLRASVHRTLREDVLAAHRQHVDHTFMAWEDSVARIDRAENALRGMAQSWKKVEARMRLEEEAQKRRRGIIEIFLDVFNCARKPRIAPLSASEKGRQGKVSTLHGELSSLIAREAANLPKLFTQIYTSSLHSRHFFHTHQQLFRTLFEQQRSKLQYPSINIHSCVPSCIFPCAVDVARAEHRIGKKIGLCGAVDEAPLTPAASLQEIWVCGGLRKVVVISRLVENPVRVPRGVLVVEEANRQDPEGLEGGATATIELWNSKLQTARSGLILAQKLCDNGARMDHIASHSAVGGRLLCGKATSLISRKHLIEPLPTTSEAAAAVWLAFLSQRYDRRTEMVVVAIQCAWRQKMAYNKLRELKPKTASIEVSAAVSPMRKTKKERKKAKQSKKK